MISELSEAHGMIDRMKNLYTEYAALLETLPQLARGQAQIKQDGKVRTFASAGRLFGRYDIDSFMLEHLKRHNLDIRMVRSKYEAVEAYDEQQIHLRIAELPDGGPRGRGLMFNGRKYIDLHDLLEILRRKYDGEDIELRDIETVARVTKLSRDDLHFTKRFRARTHRGITLYTAQTMVELSAGQAIVAAYPRVIS
jgi:hypothetical protein